jgi:hypothetical protein
MASLFYKRRKRDFIFFFNKFEIILNARNDCFFVVFPTHPCFSDVPPLPCFKKDKTTTVCIAAGDRYTGDIYAQSND